MKKTIKLGKEKKADKIMNLKRGDKVKLALPLDTVEEVDEILRGQTATVSEIEIVSGEPMVTATYDNEIYMFTLDELEAI